LKPTGNKGTKAGDS
jgi:hypothetical protein